MSIILATESNTIEKNWISRVNSQECSHEIGQIAISKYPKETVFNKKNHTYVHFSQWKHTPHFSRRDHLPCNVMRPCNLKEKFTIHKMKLSYNR